MTAVKRLLQLGRIDGTEVLRTESILNTGTETMQDIKSKKKNCETGGPERIFYLLKILPQSGLKILLIAIQPKIRLPDN